MRLDIKRPINAALCAAISFSLVMQPALAQAGSGITVDPATPQTQVGAASNGVPLVNLAAPNGSGVSHNKYTDFNVTSQGVILNNSTVMGVSQLGGALMANPNMQGKSAATLILNEVTSANRSQLNGFTEIFGQKADYILANPNGITCNGCGFINTPRATLTTGAPQFDAAGGLSSLNVTKGDISVQGAGLNASGIDVLSLITRQVTLSGPVNAQKFEMTTGRNSVAYATGAVTAQTDVQPDAPLFAIDSSALGGMYAGRIAIVATEKGVGVNMQGEMASSAGEMQITADGRLALRKASASGDLALKSQTGGVTVSESAAAGGKLSAQAATDVTADNATLASTGDTTLSGASISLKGGQAAAGVDAGGGLTQNGKLSITATNGVAYGNGGKLASGGDVEITAATLDDGANSKGIEAKGSATITATTFNSKSGGVSAGQDVTLNVANLTVDGGAVAAGRDLAASATTLTNKGAMSADRNATITATSQTVNEAGASIAAKGDLTVTAPVISNSGTLSADGKTTISAATSLANASTGVIASTGDLTVETPTLTNAGRIASQGKADMTIATATNSGKMAARDDFTLRVSNRLDNQGGLVFAGKKLDIQTPGTVSNTLGGTLLALQTLNITNGSGGRAALIENISSTIQSGSGDGAAGDMTLKADSLVNRKSVFTTTTTTTRAPEEDTSGHTISYEVQGVGSDSAAPKILADKTMTIDANTISNNQGQIQSNGDMTLSGGSLSNSSVQHTTTKIDDYIVTSSNTYCAERGFWGGCKRYQTDYYYSPAQSRTLQADRTVNVFGVVETSGALNATFTGTVANTGVSQNTALHGMSAGTASDSANGVNFSRAKEKNDPLLDLPGAGSNGLYVRSKDPAAKYLVETDPALSSLAGFYGSSYFTKATGIDVNGLASKLLGDAAYETKVVRDAIFSETGRRYLAPDITSDAAQMQRLMDNAAAEHKALNLSPGISLSSAQVQALTHDIVWYEKRVVDGVEVLYPRLYLAKLTAENIAPNGAAIIASAANIQAVKVANAGLIQTDGNLVIASADTVNDGGTLKAGAGLSVTASNDIVNYSGKMSGKTVALTAGRDVVTATAVTSYQGGAAKQALVSQQASITADASLDITAGRDVAAAGAKIASNSDASLNAGRDVALGSVAVSDGYTVGDSRYTASYSRTRNMGGTVEAGNNLNITAAGDVALAGSTAKAGNDATVTAGGNVTATTVQDTESFTSQSRTKSGGFFGGSKTVSSSSSSTSNIGSAITAGNNVNVTAQGGDVAVVGSKVTASMGDANLTASNNVALGVAYDEKSSTSSSSSKSMLASSSKTSESQKSTAVGSTVTAGNDVNLTAKAGDVSVTASAVVAGNAANLTSQEGQVQFLAAKDSESSSSTSTSSNPVWWKNQGKGSVDETVKVASLTTGEGGLNVTAKTGVVVEGKAGLKESIASDPKLAWMAPLAKRNDVTFKAVNEAHEKWDYKQQGLSAPAAAVIALAVTIATDGMGSGLLGGMGGVGGAMADAGFSALVSQAAIGMINHQGDLGAVMKDLGSVETLKNLAATIATAGITAGISNAAGIDLSKTASFTDKVAYQGVRMATSTAVNTTIGGQKFGDALTNSALQAASALAAQQLFQVIGDQAKELKIDDGDIRKVLAHAVAGCAVGQITKNCVAGAIGAGMQELLGDAITSLNKDPKRQVQFAGLIGATATLLAGGDANAVNAANTIAQDARTYNRQLHVEEKALNKVVAEELSKKTGKTQLQEREILDQIACSLVQCGANGPNTMDPKSPEYQAMVKELWRLYPNEMPVVAALAEQFRDNTTGNGAYSYSERDRLSDYDTKIEPVYPIENALLFALSGGQGNAAKIAIGDALALAAKDIGKESAVAAGEIATGALAKWEAQQIVKTAAEVGGKEAETKTSTVVARELVTGGEEAKSALNSVRLNMQLTAEQAAGVRAPTTIAGYSEHAATQIAQRDGGIGVNPAAVLDAFENPVAIRYVPTEYGPTFKYIGRNATVAVNPQGKVTTAWANSAAGVAK